MLRHGWEVFCSLLLCTAWLLLQMPATRVTVDSTGDGTQFSNVWVAANSGHRQALVTWLATAPDGHSQVRARGYRLDGAPLTGVISAVSKTSSFILKNPTSAYDPQHDRYGVVYPVSPAGTTPNRYEIWGRWVKIQAGNLVLGEEVHLAGDAAGWAENPELVFDPSTGSFLLAYNSYLDHSSAVKVIRLDGETLQPVGSPILVENTQTDTLAWHTLGNGDHLLGFLNQDLIVIRRVNSDLTMGDRQAFQAKPARLALPADGPIPLVVWENTDHDIQYAWLDDEGVASAPVTLRAKPGDTLQPMLPVVGYAPSRGMLVLWIEFSLSTRRLWSTDLTPDEAASVQAVLVDENKDLSMDQAPGLGCFRAGVCLMGMAYHQPEGESWVELRRLGSYLGWIPWVAR